MEQLGEPFLFVLGVLAAWRVTALVAYERGPFGVVEALRRALARLGAGRLVACFHCLGIWVTAGTALILFGVSWMTALVWFGLAGAISVIERWLTGTTMSEGADDI